MTSPIIEEGGYMQTVRNAVDADIYYDEQPEDGGESLSEWIAAMGDDVLSRPNKLLRLLCWLKVFGALPAAARKRGAIASLACVTDHTVQEDLYELSKHPGISQAAEDESVRAMIRTIGEDVLLKRCKIMRLLNWLRVLRANPPNLSTFQQIADYCGVSRQAAKKDSDEIYANHPELLTAKTRKHDKTNRSNRRIE